jgi:O-antigen/teichoic acid export membrane protein
VSEHQDRLGARIFSGLSWSLGSRVFTQLVQLGATLLLARVLSPEEFGQLAMITVLVGFAQFFMEMGLGSAIIQHRDIDRVQLSTLFWVNCGIGALLTLGFFLSAPLVADFYGQPILAPLTRLISVSFLISALNVVQYNTLRREMKFRALGVVDSLGVLVSSIVGVALAFAGFGVWALAWQSLLGALIPVVGIWIISPFRPKLVFAYQRVRELIAFGGNLLAFNVLNYSSQNVDDVAVGRAFGAEALGAYSRAYELMRLPWRQVSGVVARVMLPAMAELKNDDERAREVYLRGIRYTALLNFAIIAIMFACSDVLVAVVLGANWLGVVPLLRIFCPTGAMTSVGTTVGWVYLSRGRADLMLRWEIGASIIKIAAILAGLPFGPEGVAATYGIATAVLFYPSFRVPCRLLGLKFKALARAMTPPALCSLALTAVLWSVNVALPASLTAGAKTALLVPGGILLYWALLHVTNIRAYRELREFIAERRALSREKKLAARA